jgi:glycosyltransferase involved in cell wall biosynthesis
LEEVREAIEQNGWTGEVEAPGWISTPELHELFKNADVFVLPSHAEGFPMSLIEAFSSAMPAIVSDVGGVSDSLIGSERIPYSTGFCRIPYCCHAPLP